MADKQLWQVVPVANDVKNDDGVIIGGQTAGTRYAPLTLIANYVHNLWAAFINALTAVTSFSSGDNVVMVNGTTAKKMSKDSLLELTAQNALADNVAPAFDESGETDYFKNNPVVRSGKVYVFNTDHSGAWSDSDVDELGYVYELLIYKFAGLLGLDKSSFSTMANAFNKSASDATLNAFMQYNGEYLASENYNISGYISVIAGKNYVSNLDVRCVDFWDKDKNFLSAIITPSGSVVGKTIAIPSDAAFARVCILKTSWDSFMLALEGNLPSTYTPYDGRYYIDKSVLYGIPFHFGDILGKAGIEQMDFASQQNMFNKSAADVVLGGFFNNAGNDSYASSQNYNISGYIPVIAGKTYESNYDIRNCVFYDKDKNWHSSVITPSGSNIGTHLVIPSGAAYVRLNFLKIYWDDFMFNVEGNLPSTYTPYDGKYYIDKSVLPLDKNYFKSYNTSGTLAQNAKLEITGLHITKNADITAKAVGSVTSLLCGVGYQADGGVWVELDDTNVVVKRGINSDVVKTEAHSLTLTDGVFIKISKDDFENTNSILILDAFGNEYTASVTWENATGTLFLTNAGSISLDCTLDFTPKDIAKKVWIFGDSYCGMYNTARWMYHLLNTFGCSNFLLNAKGGDGSNFATGALNSLITKSNHPEYIVWLMGMNDGSDSESAPSTTWKNGIDNLVAVCTKMGVTPILATIPSVPTVDNSKKTEWVRNSGLRYIDIAGAVEESGTITWKYYGTASAYLSYDGVHPSQYGAKAIAAQFVNDFPEIAVE